MAKFNCEIPSPQMQELVLKAARTLLPGYHPLEPIYKDGQWFVRHPGTGRVWSVYDGSGANTAWGFGLELQEKGKGGVK